jgi:arylsulfatase A-like enzyme
MGFKLFDLRIIVRAAIFLLIPSQLVAQQSNQLVAQPAGSTFRPNILWLTSEDNGLELGCYGDTYADTPHLDGLAARGMKFLNAWSNAPVCAPARTTIISGLYPTSLGAQHMRSQVELPEQVRLYPTVLKELGYYCSNNSKTDYNLAVDPKELWNDSSDSAHWRNRKTGQPFFSVFNFTISHESQIRTRPHQAIHDPSNAPVPAYHPDTPEVRQDWAQYYDRVTEMDRQVGEILEQLDADGLAENTIVFYYGDHGSGMPRGKRWLYESGLRVPLIVYVPQRLRPMVAGQYEPGGASKRLVSFIDLVPTVLSIAGIAPEGYRQGRAFLGSHASEGPEYLFGFRDRMDERYDMSRAVRDSRFSYIRNFMPHRPQGTYLAYMFQTPTTRVWKQLFDEGKLNPAQSQFWVTKPAEELYDLNEDPQQVRNLADDPEYQEILARFRDELRGWMIETGDLGLLPEGEMLSRAGEDPPRELGRDSKRYPVEPILSAAELASDPKSGDLPSLLEYRLSRESAVRFWVANGLLLRALLDQDREAAVKASRAMAGDPSPYVRAIVNETLGRFGGETDRRTALRELLRLSDPRQEGVFAAIYALNGLDWCRPTAIEVGNSLEGIPSSLPGVPKRYESYVGRMIERIREVAFEEVPAE